MDMQVKLNSPFSTKFWDHVKKGLKNETYKIIKKYTEYLENSAFNNMNFLKIVQMRFFIIFSKKIDKSKKKTHKEIEDYLF
jgi:hypothetical protein